MCKLNKRNDSRRIDPCMKTFIKQLNDLFLINKIKPLKIVSCCCGHNKYPMTIIVKTGWGKFVTTYDLVSGRSIPRKKKFYKKDKQGYYYIPEVIKE